MNAFNITHLGGLGIDRLARNWWLVAILFAALLASGCRHAQERFYPIGIYGAASTNDLRTIRTAGFNAVYCQAEKRYLDAAERLNLKVLASPGTSAGQGFDPVRARAVISEFDRHPALWAWYLIDEPDLHHVPPAEVKAAQAFVKSLGTRKPTALVLYQGAEALNYANITDLTMIDRYPIPWLPLANFPQHVRLAKLGVGKDKPLIAVIQAFDWTYYPKLLTGKESLRPPTYEEIRCMTYCALARCATGLFYYCYNDLTWNMADHPATWEALRRVIAEVNQRLPLFEGEHLWWPYVHDYPDSTVAFNAALETSVIPALLRVRKSNDSVAAGEYLLSVNTTPRPITYQICFPDPVAGQIAVLNESRSVTLTNNWLEDKFGPFDVHIYGPIRWQRDLNR